MWGEIEGIKPTKISESYCLGEACLIVDYGNTAKRTVAFKDRETLKRVISFMKEKHENYNIEIIDKIVKISQEDFLIEFETVNNTHATRFQKILENLNK